jgi:hypothetical protein
MYNKRYKSLYICTFNIYNIYSQLFTISERGLPFDYDDQTRHTFRLTITKLEFSIKLQYKTDQTHFHSLLYNFTAIINPNLDLEQKQ